MTKSMRHSALAAVLSLSVAVTLTGCGANSGGALPGGTSGSDSLPAVLTPASPDGQTSANQSATGQSAAGQSTSGQSGSGQIGSGQTGPGQSAPGQAGSGQAQVPAGPVLPGAGQGGSLHLQTPANVRGIYLTGWTAGSPKRMSELLDYVQRNGLNAMVIDVKDDDGRLSFDLPGTAASAIGASADKISDPTALLQMLHQHNIYVIGRVVTFADPYASSKHPDWSIIQNGHLWTDYRGISWLSPWSKSARDYDIEIGVSAAKLGFDEIQYDYVRLPESQLKGYNEGTTVTDRINQVTSFLREARNTIRDAAGVPVSADVFGITSVTDGDQGVGQSYPEIAHVLDYISPMDYPSLYAPGEFGIGNPNGRPYDVIWQTVARAEQRTADLPLSVQRPWIQDYNLGAPAYGPEQLNAELDALAGAGIHSFLLWNAGNVYTNGVDFPRIDTTPLKAQAVWLNALHSLLPVQLPVRLPTATPAAPQATSVRAEGHSGSYTAELWATATPLPANDQAILNGTPLLIVSGADAVADLPALPAATGAGASTASPATGGGSGASGAAQATGAGATDQPVAGSETVHLAGGDDATLAASGNGVSLSWIHGGNAYRVWAPARQTALDCGNSMQSVELLEGR